MAADPSFTEAVRQELAGLPVGSDAQAHAELGGLVRVTGSLTRSGGDPRFGLELTTTSGAVARRAFGLVQHRYGLRPELLVRAPGGVRRRSVYGVRLGVGADRVARDLEVVDAAGRPRDGLMADLTGTRAIAYLRGVLIGSGSISGPGRPPHLELSVGSEATGRALAGLLRDLVGGGAIAVDGQRTRVVVKSGERIGELLAATGATRAFLTWDDRRLRRQLRVAATRLANADAANLRRTIDAAQHQVQAVERALQLHGWDALDEPLRAVALARLANPSASLAELGELIDPPIGKSAVHRRLRRLEALAGEAAEGAPGDR
jgi:cell division protein WhiA